ncbi:DUF3800 domain-containing protein [Serratia rubidaea]|uniref:DUF3800 domain-containing protein n=1 Tax=Serratia rubidaea TaxID=61652 RepID=UPI00234A630A|nr:DUF3800 domain-containing protein [Serratia rubidaea]MDC6118731.1 DUF3800 domain-containing protein [Serratia rubidaea]
MAYLEWRLSLNTRSFNVYCDESCHLQNDHHGVMVLGAVWCPIAVTKKIARDVRAIKAKHGLHQGFEIKWTKVSYSKIDFYLELVDYFFSNPALRFRSVIVPNKENLDHERFAQDHNTFYYKMFFIVLKNIIQSNANYRIYIDIKDTLGIEKIEKLKKILHNSNYDFDQTAIERIQHVRSHELEHLQLTDLFIGALGYVHRGLEGNKGKLHIIERIRQHTGRDLIRSTLPAEGKFNIFVWGAR